MSDLRDKLILITGASGGIGCALVEYLLSQGMRNLILHYRNEPEFLHAILHRFELPIEKHCLQADLTLEKEVGKLSAKLKAGHDPLWAVINLAGSTSNGMSWKLSLDAFRKVIDSSLLTTFLTCRELIPMLRESGAGRIINTSSIVASTGVVGASHYAAAKSGVESFTKSLALELASKNITVNTLALGYFEYGMISSVPEDIRSSLKMKIPANRFGLGSEIGGLVRYLLSDEGSYMTGQVLHLNGGLYL